MELPNEVQAFLSKFGAWIMSAIVATLAKISHEILMKRQLSWMSWLAIIGISLFWAWMAGLFCAENEYNTFSSSFIIGAATIMGEKISLYLMQNYKDIFSKVIGIFSSKK